MQKIEPLIDEFIVTWLVSKKCNYDCTYCGPGSHDVNGVVKSNQTYIDEFNSLYELISNKENIHINITGGEPTELDDLIGLCKHIKTTDPKIRINVNTNGSKGVNYYLELAKWIDYLDVSLHFEYVKLQAFLKKMGKLQQKIKSMLIIYVMAEIDYYNQCKKTCEILDKFNFNFILSSIMHEDYPSHYLELFKKYKNDTTIQDVLVDNIPTSSLDVKNFLINDWHSKTDKNYFAGWRCWATSRSLSIIEGTLFGGMCMIKKYGDIHNTTKLIDSVICQNGLLDDESIYTFQGNCMCNADIRTKKIKYG